MFSCKTKKKVDLLIKNAKVYTLDSAFTIAESIVISGNKIIHVGETERIEKSFIADRVIDLQGKPVYPGFYDAHCHLYGYALSLNQADLKQAKSFKDILEITQSHQEKYPNSYWIVGRGWDQNNWQNKSFPSNEKLNKLFPHKPVALFRIDGHAVLLNKKALDILGFATKTGILGGPLEKVSGKLTGIALDKAADSVRKAIPAPNKETLKELFLTAQENCFSVGLTSIAEAGLEKETIEFIDTLNQSGDMKLRIYAMLHPTKENFETYLEQGPYQTPFLHIRSIKLYADGALGSRGACLLKPYSDDTGNYGFLVEKPSYYDSIARIAVHNNYQLNTHAIGDSAVRLMLDIYTKHLKENNDRRWRIEHSQTVHPDDIDKYGKYNIIPAINTTHATSDMFWADERLGERIKNAYVYKNLLQQNGWLCNGSDFPIESINPILGFYAGIARKNLEGEPKEGFQLEQALSKREALRAMTIWAAKACFEDEIKGSLEEGKLADFVVLDKDIMEIDMDEIPLAKVLQTYIGGEKVFPAQ